jgi:hypothetical protein
MSVATANLERQAERTRADLSSTLDELRGTMTRTAITSGATALAREGSATLARAAVQRASDNPLATLLIGAGLCIMLYRGNGGGGGAGQVIRRANEAVKGAASRVGAAMTRTGQAAGDLAGQTRSSAEGLTDRTADAMAGAASTVLAAGSAMADKAANTVEDARQLASQGQEQIVRQVHEVQDSASRLTDRLTQLATEQPVLVAALAVAIGAAAGAALPMTDTERRYIGSTGARATAKGREVAEHVMAAAAPNAAQAVSKAGDTLATDVLGENRVS